MTFLCDTYEATARLQLLLIMEALNFPDMLLLPLLLKFILHLSYASCSNSSRTPVMS